VDWGLVLIDVLFEIQETNSQFLNPQKTQALEKLFSDSFRESSLDTLPVGQTPYTRNLRETNLPMSIYLTPSLAGSLILEL